MVVLGVMFGALMLLAGQSHPGPVDAQGRTGVGYGQIQVDYVILYAEPLKAAAMEWSAYRRRTGHAVRLLAWKEFAKDPDPVRAARRTVHGAFVSQVGPHGKEFGNETGTGYDFVKVDGRNPGTLVNGLRYLLILGDAPDGGMAMTAPPAEVVFSEHRIPTEIHVTHKDASREPKPAAGDHFWTVAPEIGDGKFAVTCKEPVSVGRVPATTGDQALEVLRKTRQHEEAKPGDWQRKLSFMAGEGRFGAFDKMLEKMFTDYADMVVEPRYEISMTYANPSSPWTCPPGELTERMANAISGGSLVTTYIGHGNVDRFDSMRIPTGEGREYRFTIGERDRLVKLLEKPCDTPTVMLIVACQTGCFDHPKDHAIGEAMLFAPGGPAAVLAGSRDTHPYSNIFVQKEFVSALTERGRGDDPMTESLLDRHRPAWPWQSAAWSRARTMTVGAAHHAVKAYLRNAPADEYAKQIEALASMLFAPEQRRAMNEAHVLLYNLLGDPAMRVRRPSGGESVAGLYEAKVEAGMDLMVDLEVPEVAATRTAAHDPAKGLAPEVSHDPFTITGVTVTFETWPSVVIEEQAMVDWSKLKNNPTEEWEKEAAKLRENHRKANNKVILGPLEWKRHASDTPRKKTPAEPWLCTAKNCEGGVGSPESLKQRKGHGDIVRVGGGPGWEQRPLRLWMKIPADMGAGSYRVRVVVSCETTIPKDKDGTGAANPMGGKVIRAEVPLCLEVEVTDKAKE
jgi:hypothetical protein